MPNEVFRPPVKFEAKAAGRSVTDVPPVGVPVGPQGFPPPLPPPPVPVNILSVQRVAQPFFGGLATVQFVFDRPVYVQVVPVWVFNGGEPPIFNFVAVHDEDELWWVESGDPNDSVTVPPDAGGIFGIDGGTVVPGTYPIT